jgi:hypothetical protein
MLHSSDEGRMYRMTSGRVRLTTLHLVFATSSLTFNLSTKGGNQGNVGMKIIYMSGVVCLLFETVSVV